MADGLQDRVTALEAIKDRYEHSCMHGSDAVLPMWTAICHACLLGFIQILCRVQSGDAEHKDNREFVVTTAQWDSTGHCDEGMQ